MIRNKCKKILLANFCVNVTFCPVLVFYVSGAKNQGFPYIFFLFFFNTYYCWFPVIAEVDLIHGVLFWTNGLQYCYTGTTRGGGGKGSQKGEEGGRGIKIQGVLYKFLQWALLNRNTFIHFHWIIFDPSHLKLLIKGTSRSRT